MALDKFSPDVQRFMKSIEADIEQHRNGLERTNRTEQETAVLRGRIKEARIILARINGDHDEHDPDS